MAAGAFDETATAAGWFDETADDAGWYDSDLVGLVAPTAPTSQPIPYVLATLAGPVSISSSTADTVPVDIGCTATLTAGRWLLIAMCSHSNLDGTGALSVSSELELRQNSTRIALSRWDSAFSSFGFIGTQPNIVGTSLKTLAVVNASGGDTISMWLRRESNGGNGTDSETMVAVDAVIKAVNLDLLVEGTDYWYAAGPNSDTAELTLSGATWTAAAASSRIGQGASEVPMTAAAGDHWVIASGEGFITSSSGGTEITRARLRRADTSTNIGTGVEHQVHHDGGQPTTFVVDIFEEDVITLGAGDQPEIQWEAANDSGGTSVQWRRSRIFVLRAGALADFEYIANAGGIQEPGGTTVEGANALTFDFGSSANVLISSTATWQSGGANWGRAWLHQDAGDVHWPASGRIEAYIPAYEVLGTSGDIAPVHFGTIIAQSGSVSWRLADQSDSGANPHTLGRNAANTADARTVLVAFPLQTAGAAPSTTGALASTLADVTASATIEAPFSGATVGTLAALTGAALLDTGAVLASTLADATVSSTAEAPASFVGTGTLAALTSSSMAEAPAVGTTSSTLDALAVSSILDTGAELIATLDALTASSTATSTAALDASNTLDALTGASTLEAPAALALAQTLDALAGSALLDTGGAVVSTLDALTVSSTLESGNDFGASITLADATSSSTIEAPFSGVTMVSLDALTAVGVIDLGLFLAVTLDDVTASSTATAPGAMALTSTLADATASSTATAPATLDSSSTLAALTVAATIAPVGSDFDGAVTLEALTGAASVEAPATGTTSATLDAATCAAVLEAVPFTAALQLDLDPLTATSAANAPFVGTLARTLDPVTSAAPGEGGMIPAGEATPAVSDLLDYLRTPGEGIPTETTVAINASGMELAPAIANRRRVIVGGAISAGSATSCEVRSGGASGTLLATVNLPAWTPVPLSVFAFFSAPGENLYIVTGGAVAISGRALADSIVSPP